MLNTTNNNTNSNNITTGTDLNKVTVLVIPMEVFDEVRENNNNNFTYSDSVKHAVTEYTLLNIVSLMNLAPEFHTYDMETHVYIPVCHESKNIISGGFNIF